MRPCCKQNFDFEDVKDYMLELVQKTASAQKSTVHSGKFLWGKGTNCLRSLMWPNFLFGWFPGQKQLLKVIFLQNSLFQQFQ